MADRSRSDRVMTALQEGRATLADCTLAELVDMASTLAIHPTQLRVIGTVGTTSATAKTGEQSS